MKRFKILETKHAIQTWYYEVEAESEEQAIEKIMEGQVDHQDYWVDDDPFESFEYEVESEEDIEDDSNDEDYQSGLLYGVDNNQ